VCDEEKKGKRKEKYGGILTPEVKRKKKRKLETCVVGLYEQPQKKCIKEGETESQREIDCSREGGGRRRGKDRR